MDGRSARRKADTYTGEHKRRINAQRYPSLLGFEPTIPVSERTKTVHALERASTVIGLFFPLHENIVLNKYYMPGVLCQNCCTIYRNHRGTLIIIIKYIRINLFVIFKFSCMFIYLFYLFGL
jgi:hypothetical protein